MSFPLFDYRGALPHPRYAEHFKMYEHIRDSDHCSADRDHLRALWERFEKLGLADPEFIERFPAEFGSRVWEMRLACTFADWGWRLVPPQKRGHGPDLGIALSNGRTMWVEATAPGNAQGDEAIEVVRRGILNGDEIDRKVSLRYLNSIVEKRAQWARWRERGIVSDDDGFVIAISGSMVPEGHVELDDVPRIVRLAFALGKQTFIIPIGDDAGEVRGGPRLPAMTVEKRSRSGEARPIKAGAFLDPEIADVSALLFSPAHFKNRPEAHGQEAGRDLVLVHNPYATVSFPFEQMRSGREYFMRLGVSDHRAGASQTDESL